MALTRETARAAALGATMIGLGVCAPPAQAAYTITIAQTGTSVTATGSGSIDFDALDIYGDELDQSLIAATYGALIIGPVALTDDAYYSGVTGPTTAFGPGAEFFTSSGAGAIVGLGTFDETSGGVVAVPQGYVSGAPLGTSTAIWAGATIMSLGLTPGAYVWGWGSGATADTFTIDIGGVGAAAVPEPSSWAMMLLSLAGLALVRTRPRFWARPARSSGALRG